MNTFRYNGSSHDAICLKAFPSSLKDDAKQWLQSLPTGSIRTWEEMTKELLDKYFSAAKTRKMRKEIHNSNQDEAQIAAIAKDIKKLTLANVQKNKVKIVGEQRSNENRGGEVRAKHEDSCKKKNKYEVATRKKKDKQKSNEETEERKHMHALPFPYKKRREKLDKQFGNFLAVLKKIHISPSFTEVLFQMPAYDKFLKKLLSNKQKLEEASVVKINAKCNAILRNKHPQKYENPGSFTIPCSLGSTKFEISLRDSGASINLIPLSIFRKLKKGIGSTKSVLVSL
ncbi:uncharacterized protein [Nicotiana sylvestris]|uniref:uncharacterized protein n=1 Tax=Nicotiana sylvestris TaxID=4096 RepID=UPI00388C7351